MRISKAQTELLLELLNKPRYVADYYRPLQKLLDLGLVEKMPRNDSHYQLTAQGVVSAKQLARETMQ